MKGWEILNDYTTVWREDDCAPDAESLDAAWRRLFGEPLDLSRALLTVDGGDCTAHLFPVGRVAVTSYRGNAQIRVLSGG